MGAKVVMIWFDCVGRKNFEESVAQFCRSVEVGSPPVLTCTVYMMMPEFLMLVHAIAWRLSIGDALWYQRSWVLRPSVSRMMMSLYWKFGSFEGTVNGALVSDCQAHC